MTVKILPINPNWDRCWRDTANGYSDEVRHALEPVVYELVNEAMYPDEIVAGVLEQLAAAVRHQHENPHQQRSNNPCSKTC